MVGKSCTAIVLPYPLSRGEQEVATNGGWLVVPGFLGQSRDC